jgi:tight adherence protein B
MSKIELLLFAGYALGIVLFTTNETNFRSLMSKNKKHDFIIIVTKTITTFLVAYLLFFFVTHSVSISLPLALLSSYLPQLHRKTRKRKEEEIRRKSWPLVIDQLASATHSGVPLHKALNQMQERGPVPLAPIFFAFSDSFRKEGSLEKGLMSFVECAHARSSKGYDEIAVKIKSTILIARESGGLEVGPILRNLSAFLRQRERTVNEIHIKQEWIKNGAALASMAPWLLLILLSFNSSTKESFGTHGGQVVLLIGLALTLSAYHWISRISDSVSNTRTR